MAAATYSNLPASTYAGFGSEGDPYNANDAGAYDAGVDAIASNQYQYPTNGYGNDFADDQQQPVYPDEYQQGPYSHDGYTTQQPQNIYAQQQPPPPPHNVPPNAYPQQLPNNQQQSFHPNEYQQPPYPNGSYPTQQSQKLPPNPYAQQPQNNQQKPVHPNDYQQPPYGNDGYPKQQPQTHPANPYPQQQQPLLPPNNQQHPYQQQLPPPTNNQQHPYQQPPPAPNNQQHPYQQQQQFNGHPNAQVPKNNNRPMPTNNNPEMYNDTNTMQPPYNPNMDNQYVEPRDYQQTFIASTQRHPASPVDNQHYQPQSYPNQPEHQMRNRPPKQEQQQPYYQPPSPPASDHQISKPRVPLPSVHRPSLPNENDDYAFEPIPKANNIRRETKPSKPNAIHDVTNKKKEEPRENKPKDRYSLSNPKKTTTTQSKAHNASCPTEEPSDLEKQKRNKKSTHTKSKKENDSRSDEEQRDTEKSNRHKKPSHSHSKPRKTRRDDYRSDDDYSSDDDEGCRRCKSRKTTTASDTHFDRKPRLPPLRRAGKLSHLDPYPEQSLPPKRASQRRFSQFDESLSFGLQSSRHGRHHMQKNTGHIPPHQGSYDPLSDYEKRNGKPKRRHDENQRSLVRNEKGRDDDLKSHRSQVNKTRNTNHDHHDGKNPHACERCGHLQQFMMDYLAEHGLPDPWGHGRRGNSKAGFNSSGADIPFSQPPVRSETYVESERIRAVRDAQGYYIPYKQYTLRDYNELKKGFKQNPYSDRQDSPIDRKELFKKGQEYGTFIEKNVIDGVDTRASPPKEMPPVKPWHGGISQLPDVDEAAKRERALEYAKVQVRKYQETNVAKSRPYKSDSAPYGHKSASKINGHESHLRICSICNGLCTKQKPNV